MISTCSTKEKCPLPDEGGVYLFGHQVVYAFWVSRKSKRHAIVVVRWYSMLATHIHAAAYFRATFSSISRFSLAWAACTSSPLN